MRQATRLWTAWQALLQPFAGAFTRPGHRRFVEWVTVLSLNVEEHTVTQSAVATERIADWRAMERPAEYGAWRADCVARSLIRLVERAPGRLWHGYHVSAVDDTKAHRSGEHVWGACTFEYTARRPNRAQRISLMRRGAIRAPYHNQFKFLNPNNSFTGPPISAIDPLTWAIGPGPIP